MALLLQATGNVDAELEHGRKCGNDGLLFEPQDVAPVHVPGGNWSQVGGRGNDRARLIQPPLTVRGVEARLCSGPLVEPGKILTGFREQGGKSAAASGIGTEPGQGRVIKVLRHPR